MYVDKDGCRWYKGNLHTHTTRSDGRKTPEEAIELYRSKGYDFLALTDHWVLAETRQEQGILLLSGCEYDVGTNTKDGIYHIVAVGMENGRPPLLQKSPMLTPQHIIDAIREAGGLPILAHPAWSLNDAVNCLSLKGLAGVEIYNSVSGPPWNCRPYAGEFVDTAAVYGRLFPCFGSDDAHFYEGDETRTGIWVKAAEPTAAALMQAMNRGDFYASQGPRFSIERAGNHLSVYCCDTPVERVTFFSDVVYVPDRVTQGRHLTRADYTIKANETFVRVELVDEEGRMAWSSPMDVSHIE